MTQISPATVYIVDDDPGVLAATGDVLGDCGFEVVTFVNGRDLIARIEQGERPAVVVSDIQMPHINGVDLRDAVHLLCPDLPFMFMSAEIGTTDPARIAGYIMLEKPFTCSALTDAVEGLIRA